ncbi:MAG: sugar phosphate isomerase/epimerase, partial [Phycisphaerae bacterium]|nr:sugar phosphate isomerase/epimerase [Phycisphaerae bacterium]
MRQGILLGELMKTMSLRESVLAVKEIGYSCVELPAYDVPGEGELYEASSARAVCDWIRDQGIEPTSLQCHYHRGFGSDGADACVRQAIHMLDVAEACGVGVVNTVSGILTSYDSEQWDRPFDEEEAPATDDWRRLIESYHRVLDAAAGRAVRVAIEPVFVYMVANTATMRRFVADLGRDDLAVNYDPSHFPYHDEDGVGFIREFGDRIVHAHVKDGKVTPADEAAIADRRAWRIRGGRQFCFAPPGEGALDWAGILGALRDVGYDGP